MEAAWFDARREDIAKKPLPTLGLDSVRVYQRRVVSIDSEERR
jgi:hypothetical protein